MAGHSAQLVQGKPDMLITKTGARADAAAIARILEAS
jgi:hypothetical protein